MRYMQEDIVMKRMNKRLSSNKIWKTMFHPCNKLCPYFSCDAIRS